MKRSSRSTVLGVAFGAFLSLTLMSAQRTAHPGSEPFTPTRMDWLIVELQACCRIDGLPVEGEGFDLQFTNPDSETVLIYVTYLPTVDRAAMNIAIDSARKIIDMKTKYYGWQDWVKVREDVHMGNRTPISR
jgi:hypothetical protein